MKIFNKNIFSFLKTTSKYILFVVLLVFFMQTIQANNKDAIYKAYITNNMDEWKVVIDNMQSVKAKQNSLILELVNYQYGYIGWCVEENKIDEAEKYLTLVEENVAILEKSKYAMSYVNAYKSAICGFKIGISPYSAPFNGPKSQEFADLSVASQNWLGYVQFANIQYYMPKMFGGSKTLAINYYLKAKSTLESNTAYTKSNWNYLSLLVQLAKAYTETNNLANAQAYYEKILLLEPNLVVVKNELYPALLKKIKSK